MSLIKTTFLISCVLLLFISVKFIGLEQLNEKTAISIAQKETSDLFLRKCPERKFERIVSNIVFFDSQHYQINSNIISEEIELISTSVNVYPSIKFFSFKINNSDLVGYSLKCRG
ncbi:hypothetical protein [Cohaesibacter celericrescens]|uniref:hypothetical protein n=1 Tax=Cohaesibacter celericrescens TaxID=2067669 RepID=UPI0011AECEDE|nr:hypothetical protein [Cohaesibacter celericrescens]